MKALTLIGSILVLIQFTGANPYGTCPLINGEFDVLLPDDKYCNFFYKCDWGTPVEIMCPDDLFFDYKENVCNYRELAQCYSASIGNGGGGEDGGEGGGVEDGGEDGGECNGGGETGGEGRPECPAEDGEFVTHIPHEDCTKFWKCDRGVAVEQDCPIGLHFNPILSLCDYPEQAGCEGEGGVPSATEAPTPGEEIPTTAPAPGYGRCESLGCPLLNEKYPYYLPVPDDCTRFCECNWGIPYEFICPDGLYFNPEKNVCDYKQNVNCQM